MMVRYAIRSLRARRGGFLGAFLALLCAAALITACGALLETGLRGRVATERYAAAPLVVAADQNVHHTTVTHKGDGRTKVKHKQKPLTERAWLPQEVARKVAAVPGVRAAVSELTFPAQALVLRGAGAGPASYGHAWSSAALTPFTLTEGRAPEAASDLVVDRALADRAGLTVGDRLTVQSTAAPRTYRITGIAAPAAAPASATPAALRHQTSLFFSDAEAARLAGRPGQVAAVGVLPEKGADAGQLATKVEGALAGTVARVHAGESRGLAEFPDAAKARTKLISMGGAIGGTALLVAVLVVAGTFALSIQQRHRELALLRAIAATPAQIRALIGREALLVGAVAGVLGALAGLPLAHWLLGRFTAMGAVPATIEPAVGLFPMLAAVAATVLGSWTAARVSARRVSRIRPAEALGEAAVERPRPALARTVAGLVLLAGGTALILLLTGLDTEPSATPVTYLAVVVLAGAVALLGPVLVRATAALLSGPLRSARPGGHLATANLRGNAIRMASAVTPLTLLIGLASTVVFVQPTLGHAAQQQVRDGIRADWVLASQGPGVPSAAASAIRAMPGVTAATEVVRTSVRVGLEKFSAQGVTGRGLERTWDPKVDQGTLAGFGAGDVAVSRTAADSLGVRPGSEVRLTLGDGTPATAKVKAVYASGLGFGDLTLPHELVVRHLDNPLAAAVLVATDRDRAQLGAAIGDFPGVRVLSPGEAGAERSERDGAQAGVNHLAMGLIVAFTAIAAVNTLAMSTSERVREFAVLRLTGASRRQVLRMLRLEALSVLLLAVLLGSGTAAAVLTAFSVGITGAAAPAVLPSVYALIVAAAGLLALTATALPGRVALRPRPVEVAASQR